MLTVHYYYYYTELYTSVYTSLYHIRLISKNKNCFATNEVKWWFVHKVGINLRIPLKRIHLVKYIYINPTHSNLLTDGYGKHETLICNNIILTFHTFFCDYRVYKVQCFYYIKPFPDTNSACTEE